MLTAIIVAGGSSRRAGFDKLLAPIAGRTVIGHTLAAFQNCDAVASIIVVVRADRLAGVETLLAARFPKLQQIVEGGVHRQDSVRAGLGNIAASADFVAVHDAARPLVTGGLIERVLAAAQTHGAAAAAEPVRDTLKRANADHVVCGGVDREGLYAMQTPQIFARDLLLRAYEQVAAAKVRVTDEISAIEQLKVKAVLVPNHEPNFKITYADDLRLAEFVLNTRVG